MGAKPKKFLAAIFRFIGLFMLTFFLITIVWVVALKYINPPVTYLMLSNYFVQDYPIEKEWKDYEEISSNLALAVVAAEDQNFLNHCGFDIQAIKTAIKNNAKKNKKSTKGASTISQQTAKNVFLWSSRSWIRKGFEVYFTGLIELVWGKQRILEVYMNIVELGKGIYGAEAASQQFFKKSAKKLSKREAALLAAVLPNPIKYKANAPSGYVSGRVSWIQGQMSNIGKLEF